MKQKRNELKEMNNIHQYLISFQQKTYVLNNIPPPSHLQNPIPTLQSSVSQKLNLPSTIPLLLTFQETTKHITYLTASLKNSHILGGKGGFGTLLKGQSKRAPNKVTLNFGACRDLNGRRLRFVNEEVKIRTLEQDGSKYNASGWYLDVLPNWSGVSTKAMRRNEIKRKRDMEEVKKRKEAEEAEKERLKMENERKVMQYVNYEEGGDGMINSEDIEQCILQGLVKKRKKDVTTEKIMEETKELEDNNLCTIPWLGILSGEIQQINTQSKTSTHLKSTSDFATGCILLPNPPTTISKAIYYEIKLKTSNIIQIGWTKSNFSPETIHDGIGDDSVSYGYDGSRQLKFHNSDETPYGTKWNEGDVIGSYYNPTSKSIGYYCNGMHLGIAFDNVDSVDYPAFSLDCNEEIELLDDCFYCPKDCIPVQDILNGDFEQDLKEVEVKDGISSTELIEQPEEINVIDLNNYKSSGELHVLGLDVLKYNLQLLGCKCGGTLEERANRLFSLKGLDRSDFPKKVLAKK